MVIDILKNFDAKLNIKSINHLKKILISLYETYREYTYQIGKIWEEEGKIIFSKNLLLGTITLETAIIDENYYITTFDILLLSEYYNLPIVLVSSYKILNLKDMLITNKNTEKYYFILVPKVVNNKIPEYKLFTSKEPSIKINQLTLPFQTSIRIENSFNLKEYLIDKSKVKIKLDKGKITEKLPSLRQKSQ